MSDYETTQRKRNMMVGIFVIVGICSLIWLIFKFGDLPTTVSKIGSFELFVQFPTAHGVQKDTPVNFCGYQIGRVTDVMSPDILEDKKTGQWYHQTKVVLRIDKKYVNIPSSVEVKLMRRGLGSSYIELTVDPNKLPAEPLDPNRPETKYLVDKMLIQGSTGMTSEFFPAESQEKLQEFINGLTSLINNADKIIGDPANRENFKLVLTNLAKASRQANKSLKEFEEFSAAGTAAVMDTAEQLTETLIQLRLVLERINNGEGTAGRLLNDGRLYENLLENTQQMEELLKELKAFVTESRQKGVPIKLK